MNSTTETIQAHKTSNKIKIIKRYQNRKLYDTQQSCYVTLDDIAKMIRTNEEVMVIDNKSKNDITAATLTQIIFEAEKKASQYAPLFTLREIIQNENGSISSYLSKLGAFPADHMTKHPMPAQFVEGKIATDDLKATIENRVSTAATRLNSEIQQKSNEKVNQSLPLGAFGAEENNLPTSTLSPGLPSSTFGSSNNENK